VADLDAILDRPIKNEVTFKAWDAPQAEPNESEISECLAAAHFGHCGELLEGVNGRIVESSSTVWRKCLSRLSC